jgi:ribosome-associated translation inhibitor RaiA
VTSTERAYAARKIEHLRRLAPAPVLFVRVDLVMEPDPGRERPAVARAEFDVDGRLVRAHVAAPTMLSAVDLVESRLRRRLERIARRTQSVAMRHRDEHSWHHGDVREHRPEWFPRPVDERAIVRRKTFALAPMTVDEAVVDLELLDHEFHLFREITTGNDCVVTYRAGDGYELLVPATSVGVEAEPPVQLSDRRAVQSTLDDARALLDATDERFVFFLDAGRGRVLYRRYDGNYGLITPADE